MDGDLKERIEAIMGRYPTRRSAIMPALCLAQESGELLRVEILNDIADVREVPEIRVYEVNTFDSMMNRESVCKFHIQLCTKLSCLLSQNVRAACRGRW